MAEEDAKDMMPGPLIFRKLVVMASMGNVLYSLWHLNTESPVGRAVWGSVGSRALLEKVHHGGGGGGQALR